MDTTMTFTAEQWARHEKFVEMVRAAKKRKENWIKKMQAQWAEEDQIRQCGDTRVTYTPSVADRY